VAFANDDFENARRVKYYWEVIADNLKKAGWSWGWVSAVDLRGRTIWIVDAHRGDGKRFVVRADEKLAAFLELARMISTHLLTKGAPAAVEINPDDLTS